MAGTPDQPDVIPEPTCVSDKDSSSCTRQQQKDDYRKTRLPSVFADDDPPVVAEAGMGTLPRVFESVRTVLSRNVITFLGVQTIGELCDRLKLDVQRQEGSDVFTVGGDLPKLNAFHEEALTVFERNSGVKAYGMMFGEDYVESMTSSDIAFTCKLIEDSQPSACAFKTLPVEHSETVQAELQTLPLTPGSSTILLRPVSSPLVFSNSRGSEALMPSTEIFLDTHTQLCKQAVLFLGILQISMICEDHQLKLFSHQGISSFEVVGPYQDLQLLHQKISQLLSDNSTKISFARVYGMQMAVRHARKDESFVSNTSQSQVGATQPAASKTSSGMPGSSEDKSMDLQTGGKQMSVDSQSVCTLPLSNSPSPGIRQSEKFQLNKLTMDLVEIVAKQKLSRIEEECKVKIRRDPHSTSMAEFLSVVGVSEVCDLSRGLDLLKQECLDVSRGDIQEAVIKLERKSNRSAVEAMDFDEMRVVGTVGTEKCTLYGLKHDVEVAENKIRQRLESPGLPLTAGSRGTFTLESGQTVIVKRGNIIQEDVDVIVNAANELLDHLGGVAAAICKAAGGMSFQEESRRVVRSKGSIREGEAVSTGAGLLPFKMIVHAVAPRWSWNRSQHSHQTILLKRACYNSLVLSDQKGATSVAIPGLGSGIYGIPKHVCAQALLDGAEEFFKKNKNLVIKRVVFIDLDDSTVAAFMTEARKRYSQSALREARDVEKQDGKREEQGSGANAQTTRSSSSWFSWLRSGESTRRDTTKEGSTEQCSICFDRTVNVRLQCGHEFCKPCIDRWAKQNRLVQLATVRLER